jgi:hypothetical protein
LQCCLKLSLKACFIDCWCGPSDLQHSSDTDIWKEGEWSANLAETVSNNPRGALLFFSSSGSLSLSKTICSYMEWMHLVTRPNILVELGNLLVIVHISINYCTYIYVICKRSTAILWAIHTLPKEFIQCLYNFVGWRNDLNKIWRYWWIEKLSCWWLL